MLPAAPSRPIRAAIRTSPVYCACRRRRASWPRTPRHHAKAGACLPVDRGVVYVDVSMSPDEIQSTRSRACFPTRTSSAEDSTGGGDHFAVHITSASFAGRSLVERHQMVYRALGIAHAAHPRVAAQDRRPGRVRQGERTMADPVVTEIENEIRDNKIMIYMKGTPSFPQCGFSAATIEIFEELGHALRQRRRAEPARQARGDQALLELADGPPGLRRREVHRRLRHRARDVRDAAS